MDFINYKGKPLTRQTLRDINALFTLTAKDRVVPQELQMRLADAGVEIPYKFLPAART